MPLILSLMEILGTLGKLFAAPFTTPDTLWIIIPIYINWVFTDIYQEKKGTDLGNAITNGTVAVWVGMDWGRTTLHAFLAKEISFGAFFATKLAVVIFFIVYGLIIITEGIRVKKITHYIGRVREVTYFSLMLTPIFYNVVPINLTTFLAILIGFPIFYFAVELICRITPTPKTYDEEQMPSIGKGAPEEMPDLGAEMPQFQQQPPQYSGGMGGPPFR